MRHDDLLGTFAEVGVTFAGFAGLVSVVRRDAAQTGLQFYSRIAMIGFSVQAAAYALVPRVLSALGLSEAVAWRASAAFMSLALAIWSLYGASRRRLIAAAEGIEGRAAVDPLTRVGIAAAVIVGACATFGSVERVAGVYVAALFGMLVSGGIYFVGMLIPRR